MGQGAAARILSGCAMPWGRRSLRARWHSMGSAGCGVAWLQTAVGRSDRPHATESAPSPIPSLGIAPLWELVSASCLLDDTLSRLELSAVPEHGVHDDGEPPGEGDTRLSHRRTPADAK